eukprot:gene12824-14140_t
MAASSTSSEGQEIVVYYQSNVFVHTSVPASTHLDNIIRGHVRVIEKRDGAYIDWSPENDLPSDMEFQVQSYLSGDYEWGVVSTQPTSQEDSVSTEVVSEESKKHKYSIHFKATELNSIRRSDPKLAWPYAVFILKDGTTQPALHFHSGGITAMISQLQRYIWLTRASANDRLFVVEDLKDALGKPLKQHNILSSEPEDPISKLWSSTYGTLQQFSKVTRFLMDTIGQPGGLEEHRPVSPALRNGQAKLSSEEEHEFEILHDRDPDLGPIVPIKRGQRLQPEEWCAFMDREGRIKEHVRLMERIFRGGIHEDIRREAWKFLLGYFPYDSTYEERAKMKETKADEYYRMKLQWQTMSEVQTRRNSEFASRRHLVDKDTLRTDRGHPFYKGEDNENTQKLYNILMTYCMYNFDLGYVQGMSDLLSPILMLLEDEVDSFWCFCGLMEIESQNFELVQHFMQTQLANLATLIKFIFPQFYHHLQTKESGNLFFCFRWLLLTFKREFDFENTMLLWEVLWTQSLTPYFKLFVCLAILEREMDLMMAQNFGFNEILKHINEMSNKIELPNILARTESLIIQVQRADNVPPEVALLIRYPDPESDQMQAAPAMVIDDAGQSGTSENQTEPSSSLTVATLSHTGQTDPHCDRENPQQRSSDEVVELCENTKSITSTVCFGFCYKPKVCSHRISKLSGLNTTALEQNRFLLSKLLFIVTCVSTFMYKEPAIGLTYYKTGSEHDGLVDKLANLFE